MAHGARGRGGGRRRKIRRRRRHRPPVEPYHQRRQRPQQGILSSATECVKNIVPRWLQRYFSRNDRREAPQQPENKEDEHVINADEESANIHDDRITPEPIVSNNQEHFTSTASDCPHILMRPCVHRSHLSFYMLESPALRCQPSTSSAFPTDNSGFSKEMKVSTSQHDGGNISSTSGASSRASAKDVSQNTSVLPLWSAETGHYHTLSQTSSNKPAFNVSFFGRTSLAPVRRQKKTQQLGIQSCDVISSKVQRICQCLEMSTSPLLDVKRIPFVFSSPLKSPRDRCGIDTTRKLGAKWRKVDSQYPPVQALIIPKPVSIAANPTVYIKPNRTTSGKLQKTTQRKDKKVSSADENDMIRVQTTEQERAHGLSCGVGNEGDNVTQVTKGFVATKHPEEEEMEVPLLLRITIPMTGSSQPPVKLSPPVMTSPSLTNPAQSSTNKVQMKSPNNTVQPISRFSSPIVQSTQANVGFTVSLAVTKTAELSDSRIISEPITSSARFGASSSSPYPADPSYKPGIWSSSSGPSQTLTSPGNVKSGHQGGLKKDMSSDLGSLKPMSEGFKFSTQTDLGFRVSSNSEHEKCKNDNVTDFTCGLSSGLSLPASLALPQYEISIVGQQAKREGPKAASVGYSLGMGVTNPTPATTSTVVNSDNKSSFSFGTRDTKAASVAPFPCKTSEAKKDVPMAMGQVTLVTMYPAPIPSASLYVSGTIGGKQPEPATFTPLLFGKRMDKAEQKNQPVFPLGNSEQTRGAYSSKLTFSFNVAKPSEKLCEQPRKPVFVLGPQSTNTTDSKPVSASSKGTTVTPGVAGLGSRSDNTAQSGFNSGVTSTPRAADFLFVVDTAPSVPSAREVFDVNKTPIFGQNQGASQPNLLGFRYESPFAVVFSSGSQPAPPASVPVSNSSSSSVPVSLFSGGSLSLARGKKRKAEWDHKASLVENNADGTQCGMCESAKPGASSAFKGFGKSSSSLYPAVPSFKPEISSSLSGPLKTLTSPGNVQSGQHGGLKRDVSSDSRSLKPMSEGFKVSAPIDLRFRVSSNTEHEKVKNDNVSDFTCGLSSGLSLPASLPLPQYEISMVGQQAKREGPKAASVGYSLGTGVTNPTPATTSAIVTSEDKSSFSFGTRDTKAASVAPFPCKTSEAKKHGPMAKGQLTLGTNFIAPIPSASLCVLGDIGWKQPEAATSTPLLFGKRMDKAERESQPVFSLGNSEQIKGFGTSSSSSNPAVPSFKRGISSSLSGPSQTLTNPGNVQSEHQSGLKRDVSSDSGSFKPMSEGFKFSAPIDLRFRVSYNSEHEKVKNDNVSDFTCGLSSGLSIPASSALPQCVISMVGQQSKREGPKAASVGYSSGTGVTKPTPAAASTIVTSEDNSSFSFGTRDSKAASVAPFPCKTSEAKKDVPMAKGQLTLDTKFTAPIPSASLSVSGGTGGIQPETATSTPLLFEKRTDNAEQKSQPVFPLGNSEQTKVPVSNSSSSSVLVSLFSGCSLGLARGKKRQDEYDHKVCLVPNKADATQCATCESAKPGASSAFKGFGTSSSSSYTAVPSFKPGISSSLSRPSQTLTSPGNIQSGHQGSLKRDVSSDSGSLKPVNEGFKFSAPIDLRFKVSSNSKCKKFKNDNVSDFTCGLSSGLSLPTSSALPQYEISMVGQQSKREGPKAASVGYSLGTGVTNPTPATTSTVVTSEDKSSFSFGTRDTKAASVVPFPCKTSEAKKDVSAGKGHDTLGTMDTAPIPSASLCVSGATGGIQAEAATFTPILFGKRMDKAERKSQPVFSLGNFKQTKVPVSNSSSNSVPVSLFSGGSLGLARGKKRKAKWDHKACLVQYKADTTQTATREIANPGASSAFKGFGTSSSSPYPAVPSLKPGISSSSSAHSQTLTSPGNVQSGHQGGVKRDLSSDSGSLKPMSEGFKFSAPIDLGFRVSSNSKHEKFKNDNVTDFTYGLSSGLSLPASLVLPQCEISKIGQQSKREGPKAASVGYSLSTGVTNPTPATTSTVVNSDDKSSFSFGTRDSKAASVAPFTCKTSEAKTGDVPMAKGEVTLGTMHPAPIPSASLCVSGATGGKQPEAATSIPLLFGKRTDKAERNHQPVLPLGNSEETKVPVSNSSSNSVPVSLFSGLGSLGLARGKKRKAKWDHKACLVQYKADTTQCATCEIANPGASSAFKGFGTSSSSPYPAVPSFKPGISSSSSRPSQTLTSPGNVQSGHQGGLKRDVSSDSGSLKPMSEGFKFSAPIDLRFRVSSNSKREKFKIDNDTDFTCGLSSGLSLPASLSLPQGEISKVAQQAKREGPKAASVGYSLGTGVTNPTPATTSAIVTSEDNSSFSFGARDTKAASMAPFPCMTSEAKNDVPTAKCQVTLGTMDPAPIPSASLCVSGATEGIQPEAANSIPLVFGKRTANTEPKCQPVFPLGNSEQAKDQSSSNPVFSFLNNSSLNSSASATSATGSVVGSSTCLPRAPMAAASVHGHDSTVSSLPFGNSAKSRTSQSLVFSKDSKPVSTSSKGTTVTPGVAGLGSHSDNTAQCGFNSGATSTSRAADFSFVVDTAPSVPTARQVFDVNKTPIFGQSQGASQPNPLGFESESPFTAVFSAGSQPAPPASGTMSSSSQPLAFGQQPSQSALGPGAAPRFSDSSSSSVPLSLSSGGCLGLHKIKKHEAGCECEVCLVQNEADATKCVNCESAKPGTNSAFKGFPSPKKDSLAAQPTTTGPVVYTTPRISSFPSSGMGLSGSLKARSSWQHDPYLHVSKDTDNKCITCHSTKLTQSYIDKQSVIGTPRKSGRPTLCASGTGFEDKCKPVVGTWDGDTWLVQNQQEVTECIGSETCKPGPCVKRVLTLPVIAESTVTMTASSSGYPMTTRALGFRKKFKRPVGSWQCPLCCDYNNAEDKRCVTCMAYKPDDSVPASDSSSSSVLLSLSWGGCLSLHKSKKPKTDWYCEMCLVPNEADDTECVNCESAKRGTNSAFKDQSSLNPVFSFLNNSSSNSSAPATSATGSVVGGSTCLSRAPMAAASVHGHDSTVSSFAFVNSAGSTTSQALVFSKDSIPASTSSKATAVTLGVSGPGAHNDITTWSGFKSGATSMPRAADFSFVVDTAPSVPSARQAFDVNETPIFGQSQGASQPNPLGFGSEPPFAAVFSAGSQPAPPASGMTSSSTQPSAFGQQPTQSAVGPGAAPPSKASPWVQLSPLYSVNSRTGFYNSPAPVGPFRRAPSVGSPQSF